VAITLCKFRNKFLKNKVIWDKNSGLWEQNKYFLLLKFILVLLMKEIERLNENLKLKIG